MNSSRSTPSDLKSQISSLSSAFSSALRFWLIVLAGFAMAQTGWGQVSIPNTSAVAQNFDGMGASTTATLPTGFRVNTVANWSTGTTATTAAAGTSGTGALTGSSGGGTYNFANGITASATDRSLGFLTTGTFTSPRTVVYALTNNTGSTITSLSVTFDYEKYRAGTRAWDWTFFHGATATDVSTSAASGNQSYSADAANAVVNPPTTISKSVTLSSLSIANGATYYLAWTSAGSGGSTNGQGIGLDNVSLTATTGATPSITGAATAGAFTTTYGTPSTAQTFSVSGANLAANLTATAPTGFEVASDGTTYGPTATFTQSSGSASGTLSLRLRATAAVSGTYNSQNIVLSSTGATSVNIGTAASGNAVTAKALSITADAQTKTYGSALSLGTSLFGSVGLVNSETIGSVTLTSSGSAASAAAGSYVITPSAATGGTFTAGNYTITYNTGTLTVDPRTLTITANAVTKPFGDTLASPVTGSTAFTSIGLVGSETIGSVTITYGTGAAPGDLAGAYEDQVTPSSAVGGSFDIANYAPTYVSATLTVTADPTITVNGTLAAVDTTYGTASATPASFSVSGIFLTGALTVTPPAGFEVSTIIDSDYTTSLNIPASGTLGSTPVYVRLAASTAFGTYSGNITVSGGGATDKTVATASSSVAKKALTISGLTGGNKPYDRTVGATTTGTAEYVGLENAESFAVTGTPLASFASATAANAKPITVTGYTAPSTNYTVSQPSGLTGNISPLALTVTGAAVTSRSYNGGAVAAITGSTLVGVISPDVVTIATSPGTFADINVGTGIAVTAGLTLGGADAGNYSLTQPTGLTGNITKASQTITFVALPEKLTTDAPFTLVATASSGLAVSFLSSVPTVASISGTTVTVVGLGSTNITASQAGDGNYNAATDIIRVLKVSPPILAAWDLTGLSAPVTAAATVVASNLDSTNTITRGSGAAASAGGNSFRTVGFQNDGISTANNDHFQTTLSAASGFTLSLASIDASFVGTSGFRASPGVSAQFAYSLDGATFTLIGSPFSLTADTSMPQISLADISALQNVPASTTITFRYYASGQTTTGGWGFNSPSAGSYGLRFGGTVAIQPSIAGAATAAAFTTTYGMASAEQSFVVSGSNLTANLVATAPSGFEVSADALFYAATATFTQSSGTASGSLRVRLARTAPVSGNYNSQSIILSSTNATSVNITSTASGNTVTPAALTITGLSANDKTYDGTVTATLTGTPAYVGLVNGESFSVSGTASASFADPAVGAGKPVAVTGYTAPSGNYTVAQPVGLTAIIISVYANWANGFLPGFTDTALGSDPEGDGIINLQEFAFGTNPTLSSTGPLIYANGVLTATGQPMIFIGSIPNGVDFRAVFCRRKDYVNAGLTYKVQFSSDLNYAAGYYEEVTVTEGNSSVLATDGTIDAVSIAYPLYVETPRGFEKPAFFRVAVSSN